MHFCITAMKQKDDNPAFETLRFENGRKKSITLPGTLTNIISRQSVNRQPDQIHASKKNIVPPGHCRKNISKSSHLKILDSIDLPILFHHFIPRISL